MCELDETHQPDPDGAIECRNQAYSGAYSKAEAIRICKTEPHLILRALDMIEQLR